MIDLLLSCGFSLSLSFAAGRFLICMDECLKQRRRILDAITRLSRYNWREADRALDIFMAVSYRRHMVALFLGRDPTDLFRAAERRIGR